VALRIEVSPEAIARFCRRWQITELAFFGSVLRSDFRPDSDVDVLVTFGPQAAWSLFDLQRIEDELAAIIGRPVDVVSRRGLEQSRNYLRRGEILGTAETVYAEAG
jgi:predicted nucleotidyltransferase